MIRPHRTAVFRFRPVSSIRSGYRWGEETRTAVGVGVGVRLGCCVCSLEAVDEGLGLAVSATVGELAGVGVPEDVWAPDADAEARALDVGEDDATGVDVAEDDATGVDVAEGDAGVDVGDVEAGVLLAGTGVRVSVGRGVACPAAEDVDVAVGASGSTGVTLVDRRWLAKSLCDSATPETALAAAAGVGTAMDATNGATITPT